MRSQSLCYTLIHPIAQLNKAKDIAEPPVITNFIRYTQTIEKLHENLLDKQYVLSHLEDLVNPRLVRGVWAWLEESYQNLVAHLRGLLARESTFPNAELLDTYQETSLVDEFPPIRSLIFEQILRKLNRPGGPQQEKNRYLMLQDTLTGTKTLDIQPHHRLFSTPDWGTLTCSKGRIQGLPVLHEQQTSKDNKKPIF